MSTGKRYRIASWLKNGRTFLVALDEVIPRGLDHAPQQLEAQLAWLAQGPADGLVLHAGIANRYAHLLAGGCPWIMKLTTNSALVENSTARGRIGSVEQALSLGASGVAVNVFVGSTYEREQLAFLADCVAGGEHWGMPVIAFINPPNQSASDPRLLAYACRIGAEIGADVVKTDYTGDPESFSVVIAHSLAPVLVEDSPFPETPDGTLATAEGAIAAGGAGVLFGQRVWGSPGGAVLAEAIARVIHA
jgi:DhnA family fructose-bisphosphate aldolase class Ia